MCGCYMLLEKYINNKDNDSMHNIDMDTHKILCVIFIANLYNLNTVIVNTLQPLR